MLKNISMQIYAISNIYIASLLTCFLSYKNKKSPSGKKGTYAIIIGKVYDYLFSNSLTIVATNLFSA